MRLRAHRIVRLNGHGCFRILSSIQQLYTPPIGLYICKDVHVTKQPKIPGNPPSSVVPCRRIDSNFLLLLWMYNIWFYFFKTFIFSGLLPWWNNIAPAWIRCRPRWCAGCERDESPVILLCSYTI
jgi:hypothetical protein